MAIHYGISKEGTTYTAATVVDNILGTIWIIVTLFIPVVLQRMFPHKKNITVEDRNTSKDALLAKLSSKKEEFSVKSMALLLALAFASLFASELINQFLFHVSSILVVTTIALVLAQIPALQKIKGSNVLGFFLVLIFLAVVGAYCDINALLKNGSLATLLLGWVAVLILIHGLLIFFIGGLLKQDWDIISIASNANIGGTTTAAVCATSLGRKDLQLPGLLAGSLGNAIGTYLGILVAEFLK